MNIKTLLQLSTQQLHAVCDTPRLEAEVLMAKVLGLSRSELYIHSLQELSLEQERQFKDFIQRRLDKEPLAYLVGEKEFWSQPLKVTPDTLIPRPDTEALVEWVLKHFSASCALKVADLGTGSGAIALALASERPHWKITATDRSSAALAVAQFNATHLKLNALEFIQGDWCHALDDSNYDLILSNPPYIEANDPHLLELAYEPQEALVAEEGGLADLKKIIIDAHNYVRPGGYLVLEHGYTQSKAVQVLLEQQAYSSIQTHFDLNQQPRFTSAQKHD